MYFLHCPLVVQETQHQNLCCLLEAPSENKIKILFKQLHRVICYHNILILDKLTIIGKYETFSYYFSIFYRNTESNTSANLPRNVYSILPC